MPSGCWISIVPVSLLRRLHVLERARRVVVVVRDPVPPLAGPAVEQRRALHVGVEVDGELDALAGRVDLGLVVVDVQLVALGVERRALPARDRLRPLRHVARLQRQLLRDARHVAARRRRVAARRGASGWPHSAGPCSLRIDSPLYGPACAKTCSPEAAYASEVRGGDADRVAVALRGDEVRGAPPVVEAVLVRVLVLRELQGAVAAAPGPARWRGGSRRRRRPGAFSDACPHWVAGAGGGAVLGGYDDVVARAGRPRTGRAGGRRSP